VFHRDTLELFEAVACAVLFAKPIPGKKQAIQMGKE
jgi:hypothetical protein